MGKVMIFTHHPFFPITWESGKLMNGKTDTALLTWEEKLAHARKDTFRARKIEINGHLKLRVRDN